MVGLTLKVAGWAERVAHTDPIASNRGTGRLKSKQMRAEIEATQSAPESRETGNGQIVIEPVWL
jgi:hypothetical protein